MGAMWMGCKTMSRGSKIKEAAGSGRVRKNLLELNESSPDVIYYKAGILAMRNIPLDHPELGHLGWLGQAKIHEASCAHRNYLFIPWHRVYLSYFEKTVGFWAKELRDALSGERPMSDTVFGNGIEMPDVPGILKGQLLATDHTFALPYWDWTYAASMQNDKEHCPSILLTDPIFDVNQWKNPLVARGIPPQKQLDTEVVGREAILELLTINDFVAFAGEYSPAQMKKSQGGGLEGGPHNRMHVWVGGAMGQVPQAGKDPAFWMHHCNIDRLWECWMQYHSFNPEIIYPDESHAEEWKAMLLSGCFSIPGGQPVEHPLHETLNINLWDYSYDRLYSKEEIAGAEVARPKGMPRGMPKAMPQEMPRSMDGIEPLDASIKMGPAKNLVDITFADNSGKAGAVGKLKTFNEQVGKIYVEIKNLPEFAPAELIDMFKFYFGFEKPLEDWFYFASYTFFGGDHHGGSETFGVRYPLSGTMQKAAGSPRMKGKFGEIQGLRFRVAAFGRKTAGSKKTEPITLTEAQIKRFEGVTFEIFVK